MCMLIVSQTPLISGPITRGDPTSAVVVEQRRATPPLEHIAACNVAI